MSFESLILGIVLGIAVLLGALYFYCTYKNTRCYYDDEIPNP